MKVFGIVGASGTGKTTLVARLIPELNGRGLSVSTVKHTHHGFDLDKPGKDSDTHRRAGAKEVVLTSRQRFAILHENGDDPEPSLDELLPRLAPVDLLLVEGFRSHDHPKMVVYRPDLGKAMPKVKDGTLVAIASDKALNDTGVQVLDINDVPGVADFILQSCGLTTAP